MPENTKTNQPERLEQLRRIEERLAAATGPDRELARAIIRALGMVELLPSIFWESITESLDAADALRRRALPESRRVSGENEWAPFYAAIGGDDAPASVAPTEPLAIILATIRALIAREDGR